MSEYWNDKDFVISLHDMAGKYDSEFLRKVADKLDFMIEERKDNGKYPGIPSGQIPNKSN